MSDRARKVLHDAMELPLPERAELAADLLASLDGEPEADVGERDRVACARGDREPGRRRRLGDRA